MSGFERLALGTGIALFGSLASWLFSLGIIFVIEDAEHKRASVHAEGHGGWMVIPILLCAASVFIGGAWASMTGKP